MFSVACIVFYLLRMNHHFVFIVDVIEYMQFMKNIEVTVGVNNTKNARQIYKSIDATTPNLIFGHS